MVLLLVSLRKVLTAGHSVSCCANHFFAGANMGDNDNDSYSESTTESWGSRLMGSIKGVAFGLLLFFAAFFVLWWNEGRSVETYKSLKEGKGATVAAKAESIDSALDGKLVHVSGPVSTQETLTDDTFKVEAEKVLSLRRSVQMFQWQESCTSQTEKNLGGSTTTNTKCTYKKDWAGKTDSASFKKPQGHTNPPMIYTSETTTAANAKLGAYRLPQNLTASLSSFVKLETSDAVLAKVRAVAAKPVAATSEGIFIGANASNPQVGDYRVKFEVVKPTDASVIAVQQSGSFAPYSAEAGGSIYMISQGVQTAQQMYKSAEASNSFMTWVLRLVGWLMMTIGLSMLFKPLSTLLDVLPILGSIMSFGTGLASAIAAFAFSLVTIAIAWFFYRPVLSLILIGIVVGVVVFMRQRGAAKKAAS
jgi:hypothetical protein